jgi:anti-sigma factor RsiW
VREGDLGRLDAIAYRAHLAWCKHCRSYVAQLDTVITSLESLGFDDAKAEVPPEVREAVLARFLQRSPR